MGIRIPDELEPAEVGGAVTKAEYIKDGNKTQHDINQEKVSDVLPESDGLYLRKNGIWSKFEIEYDEQAETLIINIGNTNNNNNNI